MKKLKYYTLFLALIFSSIACSDSSSGGGVTDPFGGGNNNTGGGAVTFKITSRPDQQGGTIFSATPSVAVKVSKVTISVPAQQYSETFQFDGTTVVNANVTEALIQYPAGSGVASGQQWTFKFEGTLASNNQAYTATSNYTIP